MKAEVKDTGHVHLDKLVHGYLGGMISGFEKKIGESLTDKKLLFQEQKLRLLMTDCVGDRLVERVRKTLKYVVKRRQQSNHQTTASDLSQIQALRATESTAVLAAF